MPAFLTSCQTPPASRTSVGLADGGLAEARSGCVICHHVMVPSAAAGAPRFAMPILSSCDEGASTARRLEGSQHDPRVLSAARYGVDARGIEASVRLIG